ncbi:MAG: SprB repeat-containing protein [Bacteroidetes bacterium]|nr:SprB repeat-containing protein [Bacteroidota bacterium]
MKNFYRCTKGAFVLFILFFWAVELKAQMIVAPNIPVNQMVDRLVGPGVTYSNPTLTCPTNASGKFDSAILTTIAMDSGIVLTCGSALNTNQPASFFTSLSHNTTGGDANLQAAATGTIHDLCKLEFDFVPIGDTVKFYYRFGSEEYTNYTCSNFNDIFSFFISGPGYGAPTNVALIPGTNCPVSINTVNGSNANPCGGVFAPCAPPNNALYINNTFGTSIVYDGLTQKILARAAVTPCSTYHMKFAIADVYDNVLDSGVFLEAGSFVSEAATISSVVSTNNLPAANPFAIEGCNASTITVSRPNPKPYAQTVNFSYGGTATNGVDFPVLPAAVVIPAFGVSASFSVAPFQDFIPEGIENLKVYVYGTLCANYITDSVTIDILEYPNYTVSDNDTICQGQTAILTATPVPANPNLTFNWNPVGMVIPAVGNVVTTTPNVTTTYTVTATYPGCPLRDSTITIFVEPIPSISLTATPILCAGNTNASITATGVVLYGPASFLLQPGMITQLGSPTTFTNLGAGIYTVTVSSGAGCTNSASISIVAPPSMTWQSVTPTNIPCWAANIGQIQAIAQGGVPTISYQILPGGVVNNTGNFINLGVGVYTIMATDANGCSVSTVVSIQQPNGPTFTSITSTNPNCSNQNGAINVVGNGVGIITYFLNPGNITNNTGVFSPLAAGTYTIQIVDASLCTATTVVSLVQPPTLSVTAAVGNNIPCYGGNTSITVTVSGGTPAFQYSINGGPAQASNIFNSIIAGVYTISVTDANGCSGSSIITVSQPAILDWQSVTATNIPCGGGNVGVISAVAQGGVPTISYQIFPGLMVNNIGTFSNLAAGSYNIIATDANGCTAITSVTIAQPAGPTFTNISVVDPTCNNQNGSIIATATGINGPITYTLNPGNISNITGTFSPLSAGVYTIQIVDASLCTATTVVTLTLPPALTVNANYSPIPCNGGNSDITVTVSGGTPTFNYSINGGPSQPSNIFNGVLAGVYTLSVTDANGCVGSTSITLTEPSSVQVQSVTLLNPSCVPGNDGSITIVATGGTPAYQYSIGGANQASNVFLNVAAGNYTITATDINGCSVTSVVSIAAPNSPFITSLLATDVLCNGGTDGTITATASGGLGALNYNLQPGNQNNANGQFTNLGAGVYTITVGDANGCTVSNTIAIVEPSLLNWTVNIITNVNCNGGNDGDITIGAAGGTGIITYTLQPNNITNNTGLFPNLIAGVYTMTSSDINGCTLVTTLQVTQGALLSWSTAVATNVTCNGGADGSITTSTTGGNAPINYNLQPGNQNNAIGTFTNLAAGVYTVLATDANGCSISTTLTITEPPILQITNVTTTAPSCVPGNDGSITIVATGGTPAYQYSIGGANQASNVFLNVAAGNYTITATDINGCSATSVVSIAAPNSPFITSLLATDVLCNGGTDGTITATASGGLGALNYNLQPGNQNNANGQFTNLGAGVYTITVGDANGCTVSNTIAIVEPSLLNWTVNIITNVNCNGGNDGDITIGATGGTGIITYTLQPNNITNNTGLFPNLIAGVYTMTATDVNGCTLVTTLQVTQGALLSWSTAVATNVTCNGGADGSITTSTTGGNAPINYNLQPGNQNNAIGTFTNLAAGVYTVLATDANGCSISTTLAITEPPILQITNVSTTAPSCVPGNDGSITIVATGGTPAYQYSIGGANQASNVFLNVAAGNYTITATDINGCSVTSVVSIAAPNSPFITSLLATDVLCNGGTDGTITATASGGLGALNYNLQPGNQNNANGQFTNLGAGVYTITVGDANGCTVSSTIAIVEPSLLNWTVNIITNVNCNGGNDGDITIGAAGGTGIISYTLQPNNITNNTGLFPNLIAGVYTMTATDINGCTLVTTLQVTQGALLSWSTAVATNVTCNGGADGSITTSTTGGNAPINYNLQPGNQNNAIGTFTNLAAGVYTVLATDANGCSISTTLTITEPPILQITNVTTTAPSCVPGNDGSVTIVATGGTPAYQYSIGGANQASNVFLNVAAGNYTITATDIYGCSVTSVVSIAAPNSPVITSLLATDVLCNGGTDGTITATASGGLGALNYNLQPGNQNNANGQFTNLGAGVYTITVGDANGCTVSSTIAIVEPSLLNWTVNIITNVNCNGGNDGDITIGAAGGTGIITYTLQPNNITNNTGLFPNLIAGVYTMTATDVNGCTLVTTLQVTQGALLSWSTAVATNVTCNGGADGSITTSTTGGNAPITYNLQPGIKTMS